MLFRSARGTTTAGSPFGIQTVNIQVSGRYFDECGNPLESPVEPVGEFSLQSFRTIDDQVSDALEIPTV